MITKKKAAALVVVLLGVLAGILKQCDDSTPLVPGVPVVGGADAGVVHQSVE
jgi:hypothetical protein